MPKRSTVKVKISGFARPQSKLLPSNLTHVGTDCNHEAGYILMGVDRTGNADLGPSFSFSIGSSDVAYGALCYFRRNRLAGSRSGRWSRRGSVAIGQVK